MAFQLEKINNKVVKPVPIEVIPKEKIRGADLFDQLYCNVFICSKKKTGKSSIVWNILNKCMGRDTKLIIFCSTVNKDPTYLHIKKHFKEKGNIVITYSSIKEGKEDNLNDVLNELKDDNVDEDSDSDNEDKQELNFNMRPIHDNKNESHVKEKKKRKEKFVAPEIIFLFDDLSKELLSSSVSRLVKTHRHFKSKVIISTQHPNDLLPESIRQMDYVILGRNHTLDKLEKIYTDLDLSIPFVEFVQMYQTATQDKYNFFYINVVDEEYRVNFNYRINK